jgi:hypothetical protein
MSRQVTAAPDLRENHAPTLVTGNHPCGWWMFAPEELGGYREPELSNNLRRICAYARTCGCDYILFDSDAEIDKNLPVFEDFYA